MEDNNDTLLANVGFSVKALTWDRIKEAVTRDESSQMLMSWIMDDCSGSLESLLTQIKPFWTIRSRLRIHDGVPMLDDRTVIPTILTSEVLETLHSAHQGTHSMTFRSSDIIYWPPVDLIIPEYPFQHICMDYFSLNNKSFGIFVDRFTNWPGVYIGDSADDVCRILAQICEDYGIPETLTTDGAHCYMAKSVRVRKILWHYLQNQFSCKSPHQYQS